MAGPQERVSLVGSLIDLHAIRSDRSQPSGTVDLDPKRLQRIEARKRLVESNELLRRRLVELRATPAPAAAAAPSSADPSLEEFRNSLVLANAARDEEHAAAAAKLAALRLESTRLTAQIEQAQRDLAHDLAGVAKQVQRRAAADVKAADARDASGTYAAWLALEENHAASQARVDRAHAALEQMGAR